MESIFKIEKKLKAKEYSEQEICNYLNSESISLVYMVLKEIWQEKINSTTVMNEVIAIANNDREISSKGLGVTTLRIVAISTLKKLGHSEIFDSLEEEEKNLVRGAFN
ncbi:hypothetical protein AF435_14730 [Listeria monocytogenes]|uniref:Uncharacterized protein n=1 Tax=Listeria monocytogenes TaxID=1639 RepID=A0AAN2WHG5_LISMN|nr:hypothetical protein [Listeria monocytogenes]EAC3367813.1 hypothetical protein [Listeria monocytogenes]EAC7086955.1 hypothetical protein [Listeria monocytogenes]EAC8542068.1 hypothetical protein [Listeria monocytogenes]EAC8548070.1 hypothetical protein [Listeria monocytogenes]